MCLAAGGESKQPAFDAHVTVLVTELELSEAGAASARSPAAEGDRGGANLVEPPVVDAPAAVVVCEPAALPTAAAVVSCEICMGELTMSQMVRLSCKHLVCGACVLEIRRSYEEQPGSSLEDQIDVTYDGTQPSYAAPPCCPYCRHPITADELAVAAAAAAPVAPAAADELAVAAATPTDALPSGQVVAAAAVGAAHAPVLPPGLLPFVLAQTSFTAEAVMSTDPGPASAAAADAGEAGSTVAAASTADDALRAAEPMLSANQGISKKAVAAYLRYHGLPCGGSMKEQRDRLSVAFKKANPSTVRRSRKAKSPQADVCDGGGCCGGGVGFRFPLQASNCGPSPTASQEASSQLAAQAGLEVKVEPGTAAISGSGGGGGNGGDGDTPIGDGAQAAVAPLLS